jgi:uncharacterized protein with PQ loop repeat
MITPQWVEILDGVFCTTFAFVPQLVKIYKQGEPDLSDGLLSLYLFGVLLGLAYGLLIHAQVALTNAAIAILIAAATIPEGPERATEIEQLCRRAIQRLKSSHAVEAPKHRTALQTRS